MKNRLDSRNWGEYFSEGCTFLFCVRSFLLPSAIVKFYFASSFSSFEIELEFEIHYK